MRKLNCRLTVLRRANDSGAEDGGGMIRHGPIIIIALAAALLLPAGRVQAEEKEPSAILELGGAGEWSLRDGSSSYGGTVAIEVEPIRNWLELEAGVTPRFGSGHTEWSTDLLFKRPYTLSDTVEFMIGVGPEWVHATGGGKTTDTINGEAVLDFMFWSSSERRVGWYVEPSYDYSFNKGREQSLGVTGGLLIGIP